MWFLLQVSIIFPVVASNIHWQWTPSRYLPAIIGVGLAWLLTRLCARLWKLQTARIASYVVNADHVQNPTQPSDSG